MRKFKSHILRKVTAIFIVLIILISLILIIKADFDNKQREENRRWIGLLNNKALNYKLELTSFDLATNSVLGVLRLDTGLPRFFDEPTIYYSPLIYEDACTYGAFNIAGTMTFSFPLKTDVRLIKFAEKMPDPVNVSFRALGNPAWYPFDVYIIAGKVKTLAYIEKDNKKEYIHKAQSSELLSIKNSIDGLFIRSLRGKELYEISSLLKKDKYLIGDKKYIEVDELIKFNNLKDSFIMMVERSYFIRYMAVILGIIALLSAIFIAAKVSYENISINIMGYILGLWGIRNILLGDTKLFLSYLDYFVLSFYLILFTGILFRVIWGTIKKK